MKEKLSYGSSEMKLLLDAGLSLKPAYQQNEQFKTVKKIDDLAFHHFRLSTCYEKSVSLTFNLDCALGVLEFNLYCKLRS